MKKAFEQFLRNVIADPETHARWLNTLSMMENTGAKKISRCQHPVFVTETILKHSAEESRHGYYLKKQISRVLENACPTYEPKFLLAPEKSYHYLIRLDIAVCRFLKKEFQIAGEKLKYAAYLLVTFAIEVRADDLYPVYQEALQDVGSKVNVKSIIAEETGHLEEMNQAIEKFFSDPEFVKNKVREMEGKLFSEWTQELALHSLPAS
jgi:rubrerythrin